VAPIGTETVPLQSSETPKAWIKYERIAALLQLRRPKVGIR